MKKVILMAGVLLALAFLFTSKMRQATYPAPGTAPTFEDDAYAAWSSCQDSIAKMQRTIDGLQKEVEQLRWIQRNDTLIYMDGDTKFVYPRHAPLPTATGSEYPYQ